VSFTFHFKKLSENALRFVIDVVLNILPGSADFTRVDGTHHAGSVTRIARVRFDHSILIKFSISFKLSVRSKVDIGLTKIHFACW